MHGKILARIKGASYTLLVNFTLAQH